MFFDKAPIQAGRPSKFFRTLRIWTLFKYDHHLPPKQSCTRR